jgi:predicted lipid-binding transport protein (Tim44 family)
MTLSYDLIIYAIIAVLILAKLWSVLGQRNTEDRERPNPFAAPPPMAPGPNLSPVAGSQPQAEVPLLLKPPVHAPASLAGGLAQVKESDPAFDEKQFLQTARTAFTLILRDFAKGDLSESTKLLGPTVLPHFRKAIEERVAASETMEHKLHAIREAECVSAKIEDNRAIIAVRFVSEQESTLRDSAGNIIGGSEGKLEEITDIWTFARDAKPTDPTWILVETRS